ncbi:MAG TPA: hypothetical protein DCZ72_08425 [Armatimonadetes bacterium]|nr:hypothetical protein [Armatimonadota bacterium]
MSRYLLLIVALALAAAAQEPLHNAALPGLGGRVTVTPGPGVHRNTGTPAESIVDGNAHTRVVFTGVPYTYRFELLEPMRLESIVFTTTDLPTEVTPSAVTVTLSDGTTHEFALDPRPDPIPRGGHAMTFPLGATVEWVEVTATANYEAENNWGGLGEIALLTALDLPGRLTLADWDPDAPTFIDAAPAADTADVLPVTLPPRAEPGVWPRGMYTPSEIDALRTNLDLPRGPAVRAHLATVSEQALERVPDFPDPAGPMAQMTDRSDEIGARHDRISRDVGTLGLAYALTGDERFAEGTRVRLLGYGERYVDYPEHTGVNRQDASKVFAQRLSEAMWLVPLLAGYDYVHDYLSPADRQTIVEGLIRPAITMIRRRVPAQEAAERTQRNADWRTTDPYTGEFRTMGNWLNWYNYATILAGAVIEDQDMIDLAAADLREAIAFGISPDGLWGEGAIGYQLFALQAMAPALDIAARHGVDLWSYRDNRFLQMFESPLRYAYPDGTAAGINDSGRASLGGWATMVYDYAWLRWQDPRFAGLVNESPRQLHNSEGVAYQSQVYDELPEPPSIEYPSTVFGALGYAIARDDTKFALLDYGPHGGVHGHYDKLNLILFSGDELGGEPVFHRYEDPLHSEWTIQTVAHNTATVNGLSQIPGTGKLLQFSSAPGATIMRAEAMGLSPGALLDRTVVVLDGAIVDLYRVRATRPVVADRTLRFGGTLAGTAVGATFGLAAEAPIGAVNGYQHLRPSARADGSQVSDWRWQTAGGELRATVAGTPGQELIAAAGPDNDALLILRQTAPVADFGVVYQMDRWGPAVTGVQLLTPGAAGEVGLQYTQGGVTHRVLVNHDSGTWSEDNKPVRVE